MTKNNLFQTVSIIMLLIITLSCVSENHEIIKDEDGNVRLKCELKNGIRHGKCYHYYPSGAVQVISNWVEGVKDGESIEYFENGKIKERGTHKQLLAAQGHYAKMHNGSAAI